jgi:hypothetical protein
MVCLGDLTESSEVDGHAVWWLQSGLTCPPDAKAAAADPGALTCATPTVIKVGSSGGFDWGDAGIGAGGMLAVVALAGGGLVLVSRRRTTDASGSPATG